MQLSAELPDLAPGTRIVSNSFSMEDWEPDQEATVSGECTSWCTALFWIVPAKVEGTWQMPAGVLTLRQEFQNVYGTLGTTEIMNGRLRGDTLTFTAGGTSYSAKVSGSTMTGAGGRGGTWTARRDR